ncbi:MAG: hypothetical protein RIA10_01160 [Amphiplicatus sp.]
MGAAGIVGKNHDDEEAFKAGRTVLRMIIDCSKARTAVTVRYNRFERYRLAGSDERKVGRMRRIEVVSDAIPHMQAAIAGWFSVTPFAMRLVGETADVIQAVKGDQRWHEICNRAQIGGPHGP